MATLIHNAAFGVPIEGLDVILIEDSKPMQTILRSMLSSFKVERLRVFDNADDALQAMLVEPPNVIITDWRMKPTSGYKLMRSIRHRNMAPLCFVPVIFITAHGTRSLVEKALRGGAHYFLVKPVAPADLHQRLRWLALDDRPFRLEDSEFFGISGMEAKLDAQQQKWMALREARIHHQHTVQRADEFQSLVDEIFTGESDLSAVLEDRTMMDHVNKSDNPGGDPKVNAQIAASKRDKSSGFASIGRKD